MRVIWEVLGFCSNLNEALGFESKCPPIPSGPNPKHVQYFFKNLKKNIGGINKILRNC
jgi:hypothetical protein